MFEVGREKHNSSPLSTFERRRTKLKSSATGRPLKNETQDFQVGDEKRFVILSGRLATPGALKEIDGEV